jgi:uncharacterized protein (DUF2267 family)
MRYGEFVEKVQQRARVENWDEALNAIEATLKTLGERLTEAEAAELAAQLPSAIGRFLTVVDTNKEFGLEEFYEHVSRREAIGQPNSRDHARAVISVLEETVSPGELRDMLAQLPEEYETLFSSGSDGRKLESR